MEKKIISVLSKLNDASAIETIQSVSGGDINQAFYVKTKKHAYFIKGNENVPQDFFRVEAQGLRMIEATNSICVPHVYHYDEPIDGELAVIVMDWIKGERNTSTTAKLGEQLALMHTHTNNKHGFLEDSFIGELSQPNDYYDDWVTYYRECRLLSQFNIAIEKGRMPSKRRKRMEQLMNQLDDLIDRNVKASLLHGDLWGGNWIVGPHGEPYIIDPSVFYGDRAFEIAFTELFGGFPTAFYQAYEEVAPLASNYQDVKPLYQLYYLLVHLNMFGEGYGSSVDRILKKYTK